MNCLFNCHVMGWRRILTNWVGDKLFPNNTKKKKFKKKYKKKLKVGCRVYLRVSKQNKESSFF